MLHCVWMFCEYCELANKINPDKSSKEAKYRVLGSCTNYTG